MAVKQILMFQLLLILTIKSDPLHQYENINIPFNTQTSSQYYNYTIDFNSNSEEMNLYYLISGSQCYIPRISIAAWDNFVYRYAYINIAINDAVLSSYGCRYIGDSNNKYVQCISNYEISSLINANKESISSLQVKFVKSSSVDSVKSRVTLSCWIPSITSPMNEMWLNIDRSLPSKQYNDFTLREIATQTTNINGDYYPTNDFFYFLTSTSEPCYLPILTVNTLDTDYNGNDEYLQINVSGNGITACYPKSNTCSRYHNCLNSYNLGIASITDFIHIRTYGMGVSVPCKINDNTFGFVVTNITLSCYVNVEPTEFPTLSPTKPPTLSTKHPTKYPTKNPTKMPTFKPTNPTKQPTPSPTNRPTINPTHAPSNNPTNKPTTFPSKHPTPAPTDIPTTNPTQLPTETTINPTTAIPTSSPTNDPSTDPTTFEPTTSKLVNNGRQSIGEHIDSTAIIIVLLVLVIIILVIIGMIYILRKRCKKIKSSNDEIEQNENENINKDEEIPLHDLHPGEQRNVYPVIDEQQGEGEAFSVKYV